MAKIENTTAYPTVTPAADDLLIGTDVNNDNQTVTFKISDIVGAGGVAQDLQSVLTTGHTATKPIVLTGLTGNISCTDIYPVTVTAQGNTGNPGQILSSTGGGIQWIDSPTLTCCGITDVLNVSSTATVGMTISSAALTIEGGGASLDITTPAVLTNSGTSTFTNTVNINGAALSFDGTGQINDSNGTIGTAGYFLTSEGPGQGVAWSNTLPTGATPNLAQVLTAGNTANNLGMTFTGTSTISLSAGNVIYSNGNNEWGGNNVFSATGTLVSTAGVVLNGTVWAGSSVGSVGKFLASTGTGVDWATPTVADNTLQEVLDAGNSATGANANITLTGFIKPGRIHDSGGSPGAAGEVLTSTGSGWNWSAAGTGAVASVTLLAAGTSAGDALTITPTTGAVTIRPNAFAGSSDVGHVPSSAAVTQTTHFLRADGSWQVPPSNTPHGVENFKFFSNNQAYTGSTYYSLLKLSSMIGQANNIPNTFKTTVNPLAPLLYTEEVGGTIFVNPGEGINCNTGYPDLVMCNARIQVGSNLANTYRVQLWKIQQCAGVAPTLAGTLDLTVGAGAMTCGDLVWGSLALRTLEPGYGYFITVYPSNTYASGLGFLVNLSLRW